MTCSLAYTLFSQRGHLGAAGRLPRFMFPKPRNYCTWMYEMGVWLNFAVVAERFVPPPPTAQPVWPRRPPPCCSRWQMSHHLGCDSLSSVSTRVKSLHPPPPKKKKTFSAAAQHNALWPQKNRKFWFSGFQIARSGLCSVYCTGVTCQRAENSGSLQS